MTIANIPDFRVTLDGKDLTSVLRPRLVSLSIAEKRGESADQLDIVLDDTNGGLAIPASSAVLHVWLGWKQGSDVAIGLVDKGSFTVDEVTHAGMPDVITIRGRSVDFTSDLKTRQEKSWHGTTLGAIVGDVAKRHGLKSSCAPALASIAIPDKAQSRESDLAFLRRLGRERNAVVTIKRGALIVAPIGAGTTAAGKALPALTIHRSEGGPHSFCRQKRDAVGGVTGTWHDRRTAKRQTVTIGTADGARKLARVYASEDDAKVAATAAQGRAGREPTTMDIPLALGRADIFPEQKAKVVGYKAEIDAIAWLVAEVTHDLGDRGYTTKLKLESAP